MKKITSILIVDDDVDDREIFTEAITTIDPAIKCFTAVDGEDALEKLLGAKKIIPEIIFLDLNMPRMDGRQLLIELKKTPGAKEIPVVIYSTSSSKRDYEETKTLGAFHFLPKPSGFHELVRSISDVVFAKLEGSQ